MREFERGMYFIGGWSTLCEAEKKCRKNLLIFLEWAEEHPNFDWEAAFRDRKINTSMHRHFSKRWGFRCYDIPSGAICMEMPKIMKGGWDAYVQDSKRIKKERTAGREA